MPVCWR